MRVSDVMSTEVEYVSAETKVKDVSRLIFGRGINGVPVCKGKKVVGFITERDILAQFYPSMQEYVEDPFRMGNFERMEGKVSEVLNLSAQEIMSREPTMVTPDTPLLRAQSLMFIHKIGRLPVVDKEENLIGIICKGDIFRALVGGKIPYVVEEEYHDWCARYYDLIVRWKERLAQEIPDLASLFRQNKVKKVLDVRCGTGEHALALAKKGFAVLGLERSTLMFGTAQEKWQNLPENLKKRVEFLSGDYLKILKGKPADFGAAIFMGNALSHEPHDFREVLRAVSNRLLPKAIIVLQLLNSEKILKTGNRLLQFNIAPAKLGEGKEYAFVEFYDPPKVGGGFLTANIAIFAFDGRRWRPKAINNTAVANLDKGNIQPILKKLGFKHFSFYGGKLWGPLFDQPFKPLESDWLNVVARR